MKHTQKSVSNSCITQSYPLNITSLFIDKEYSLVVDTKDDAKEIFDDAIGLATYSNNESTIATQGSIFETLWIEGELRKKREQISRP
jgi:hypothetical protein